MLCMLVPSIGGERCVVYLRVSEKMMRLMLVIQNVIACALYNLRSLLASSLGMYLVVS